MGFVCSFGKITDALNEYRVFNQTGVKWLNIRITVPNIHDKKN